MLRRFALLAATLSLLVLSSLPAAALEVTPFVGSMMPAKTLLFTDSSYLRMGRHTVYGMSLGTSVTAGLSDRLHLTVSALDRIHVQGISVDGLGDTEEKTQHDLTFTAGLRFPLD